MQLFPPTQEKCGANSVDFTVGSAATLIHLPSQAQEHTQVLKEAAWSVVQQNTATHSECASHGDILLFQGMKT